MHLHDAYVWVAYCSSHVPTLIEIDISEQLVENINTVLEGNIDWQETVALSCVVTHCESQIGLLKFQKELNKKEMSNLLLQALQQ